MQKSMGFYVVNMPAELFMDGYVCLKKAETETRKLQKDRYLRDALILLYCSVEAELNRELNIASFPDPIKDIQTKLKKVLGNKAVDQIRQQSLLEEMNVINPSSFRNVRNGIVHFKGDYSLYGVTEQNIKRYFQFTKTFFEIVHTPQAIAEWVQKAEESID